MIRWSDKIAVFGGTFDPPHSGHVEAALGLLRQPGVKRVIVIPSKQSPLKQTPHESHHREAMVRVAFEGVSPEISVDPRELKRPGEHSYTFDTLQELAREVGSERLAFVIGTDQLGQLPKWHRFPEILGLSDWIVLTRKPDGEEEAKRGLETLVASALARTRGDLVWELPRGRALTLVPTEAADLSSTRIREHIAKHGTLPEGAVPQAVAKYLQEHELYGLKS